MIRVPGIRTGVEVWGSDTAEGYAPVDLPDEIDADALFGIPLGVFEWLGGAMRNPYLFAHDIRLGIDDSEPVGQLVLCSPDAAHGRDDLRSALAGGLDADDDLIDALVDSIFLGLQPNDEVWTWFENAWPSSFVLESTDWPVVLRRQGVVRDVYRQGVFPDVEHTEPLPAYDRPAYRIDTHPDHANPAGALLLGPDRLQEWFGALAYLVDGLITPSPEGAWRFSELDDPDLYASGGYARLALSLERERSGPDGS